jgi:hypothetical protein
MESKKPTYDVLLMNLTGGTLRKVIEDLIYQIDGIEKYKKLSKYEQKDLEDLIELTKPAVMTYLEYHSAGMDYENHTFKDFVEKHMTDLVREKKLKDIGIK